MSPLSQALSQGVQRPAIDQDKLAAQRAIFAQLTGQAPAASTAVARPAAAAEPAVIQQAAPVTRRVLETPAERPSKLLRPGSIIDIRV
jgi:hypothetical protein